jgi:3,4-dihydroxy 2-butanone 4-phosphate synthase/GTP cyclohydrolase II
MPSTSQISRSVLPEERELRCRPGTPRLRRNGQIAQDGPFFKARDGEPFVSAEAALREFAAGRMLIVIDDENRKHEGHLTMAAKFVTPEAVNFMARAARGLICVALTDRRCDALALDPMTRRNRSTFQTAFTVSIDARGTSTGISAADRALTIQTAVNPRTAPRDLLRPGHVFPLRAQAGGVLERPGHTEAAVDMARLAGLAPAGVICAIMDDDGSMARTTALVRMGMHHQIKLVRIAEIASYRRKHDWVRERAKSLASPALAD